MTIGVPMVTCLPKVYQQCTNSVPIVKNSQKTVKTAKMTVAVPIVTCLHRVRRIHKALFINSQPFNRVQRPYISSVHVTVHNNITVHTQLNTT